MTHPKPDGPTAIPSTISSTTAGSRSFGISPSASGAANATAATMTTLENEISLMRLLQSRPKAAPPRLGLGSKPERQEELPGVVKDGGHLMGHNGSQWITMDRMVRT